VNTTYAKCGVNINGDGEVVGLWFDPNIVIVDGHAYISLSPDEMLTFADSIQRAVSNTRHDAMQHDDCRECGTWWGS
jgi:hypothetical protein